MAMGITQALKLQEGSIDALAKLPQQQLIAMSQQGRISSEMLPIILNEKAQMAQQMANMQAAQQPQPPSVIEQAMATNAQAEAQMQPRESGIANLPVPEDMYSGGEEGYAGGGIVAFEDGGSTSPWVDRGGLNVLAEEANPPRAGGLGFSDYVRQYQELMAPYRQLSAEEQAVMARKGPSAEDIKQQNWMRALEAGLGIMGGQSPYAFTNIGQGSQAALKGYAEDVKERRKEEMALMQAKADAARRRREEQMADVTGGLGLFKEAKVEERAGLDRGLREREIEIQAKRLNQPPDVIRSAMAIQKPGESLSDALERYSRITEKAPDRFNAISNRLTKAVELWTQSDTYTTLNKQLKAAKTDDERTKIQTRLADARKKFLIEEAEISPGDLAYLKSVNESFVAPTAPTAKVMTMADVKATAKASGKSEEEVIAAARAKGYTIK